MAMVSMKMSQEEALEQYGSSAVSEAPQYPYGTQIRLDDEALERLGLPVLPKVGETMIITARVEVQSTSEHQDMIGGTDKCATLQITDMEVGPDKQESDPAAVLYG